MATMFGTIILASCILQFAWADCAPSDTDGKCKTCGATIGTDTYCSACNGANHAPVNGECADVTSSNQFCTKHASGACTECAGASFMYKGGCYEATAPPGSVMCKTAANGKCTETVATKEYFIVPGADNAHQSVVACGDAANGVTLGDNKKYVGIEFCTVCDAPAEGQPNVPKPATCTKCASNKYLKTETDSSSTSCVDPAECKTTTFPKTDDKAGNKCVPCGEADSGGIANCAECTYSSGTKKVTCTKCTGKYLKTVDGTTTCVDQDKCTSDSFPVTNAQTGNKCVSCGDTTGSGGWKGVPGCAKCTKPTTAGAATCTECASNYLKIEGETTSCVDANACTGGFVPTTDSSGKKVCVSCGDKTNGGIQYCSACTPIESPTTTVLVKCSACSQGKVSPGGSSCMTNYPDNSSEQNGVCVCSGGFAPSGENCVASSSVNLSTGAIAGISVAAVVVVGGLVGFLCWWFICRGKA